MTDLLPIVKPYLPPKEELIPALTKVLYSGYIAQGAEVEQFESGLKEYFGVSNILSLNSGTAALHLALILAGVKSGDEVISTPLTAEPTNTTIAQTGARIVWADVEEDTGLICPNSVRKIITSKTKAIMVVHYAGMVADLNRLYEISHSFGIPIIEDCAHAFGAKFKGQLLGYYSDYAIYSFQAIKHFTTIDGGALITKSKDDYHRAKKLRWFGLDKTIPRLKNDITEIGFKYNMNDINALIGNIQLRHLENNVEKYKSNGHFFDSEINGLSYISKIQHHQNTECAYWLYTARVERRTDFINYMRSHGIDCSMVHLRNDRHSVFSHEMSLVNLNAFYSSYVHWGCGWWIEDQHRQKIVELIKKGW